MSSANGNESAVLEFMGIMGAKVGMELNLKMNKST